MSYIIIIIIAVKQRLEWSLHHTGELSVSNLFLHNVSIIVVDKVSLQCVYMYKGQGKDMLDGAAYPAL